MTETALDLVRRRLGEVTGYTAPNNKSDWLCPSHDDSTPSLSVNPGKKGVVIKCQAGCTFEQVLRALDLKASDLFDAPAPGRNGSRPEISATYDYVDESGQLLFQVVREVPKTFKQRRPDDGGGWIWKLDDTRRVLYRLPRVIEAIQRGYPVWIAEGEKDVHALEGAGEVATCNPGGAGKWSDEYSRVLAGANVFIVIDVDDTGRAHARQVAAALAGIAASVTLMRPAAGKDIADHLAAGLEVDDLLELGADAEDPPPAPPQLTLRWITDVFESPPEQPEVLVDGLLRRGEMCVIGAPRAVGKSMLGMNLATLLGRGDGRLAGNLRVARKCKVLYSQGELDEWEAFRRWYRMAGSEGPPAGVAETFDQWRLRVVKRRSMNSGRSGDESWSESDEFIDAVLDGRVEETIVQNSIDVLIIDPWAVYYAGAENSNDEVEVALGKLRALSLSHGLSIVVFHHIGKSREAAEPEDLWRGASRLADWASTRVTMLPHYTPAEASKQNMTRQDARRFLDVFFLRRGEPTPDFSMVMDHGSGWWCAWNAPGRPTGNQSQQSSWETALACAKSGGRWTSYRQASVSIGCSPNTGSVRVDRAVLDGWLDATDVEGGRRIWVPSERFLTEPEPGSARPAEGGQDRAIGPRDQARAENPPEALFENEDDDDQGF